MMMYKAPDGTYDDFTPVSDMISEDGCDTLILYLPGFKKEQLKVQLTTSRILRISGERPIGDNKWRRCNKEFQIPPNVNTKEITAKFEGGILHIRQPKLISSAVAGEQDKAKQALEETRPPTQQEAPSSQPQSVKQTDGFSTHPSEFTSSHKSEERAEKKKARNSDSATTKQGDEIPSKSEDVKTKHESGEKHKQLTYGTRIIKTLKKPERHQRIGAIVMLLLVLTLLGLYIVNMYRTYSANVWQHLIEYKNQGFQTPT